MTAVAIAALHAVRGGAEVLCGIDLEVARGEVVAILGVSRSSMKPVYDGRKFEPRLMLPLSLSYDHRVIDGAEAARFITRLSATLGEVDQLVAAIP